MSSDPSPILLKISNLCRAWPVLSPDEMAFLEEVEALAPADISPRHLRKIEDLTEKVEKLATKESNGN